MKISQKVPKKKSGDNHFTPIPFTRFECGNLNKAQIETCVLRNIPDDANSTTHRMNVPCCTGGLGEEHVLFQRDVDKILSGQNVNDAATKFSILRRLLQGRALATLTTKLQNLKKKMMRFLMLR